MKVNKKDLTFKFFKDNPNVLYAECKPEYLELLGIKKSTYDKHKREYSSIVQANISAKIRFVNNKRSCRLREKFIFDDSKLFS